MTAKLPPTIVQVPNAALRARLTAYLRAIDNMPMDVAQDLENLLGKYAAEHGDPARAHLYRCGHCRGKLTRARAALHYRCEACSLDFHLIQAG